MLLLIPSISVRAANLYGNKAEVWDVKVQYYSSNQWNWGCGSSNVDCKYTTLTINVETDDGKILKGYCIDPGMNFDAGGQAGSCRKLSKSDAPALYYVFEHNKELASDGELDTAIRFAAYCDGVGNTDTTSGSRGILRAWFRYIANHGFTIDAKKAKFDSRENSQKYVIENAMNFMKNSPCGGGGYDSSNDDDDSGDDESGDDEGDDSTSTEDNHLKLVKEEEKTCDLLKYSFTSDVPVKKVKVVCKKGCTVPSNAVEWTDGAKQGKISVVPKPEEGKCDTDVEIRVKYLLMSDEDPTEEEEEETPPEEEEEEDNGEDHIYLCSPSKGDQQRVIYSTVYAAATVAHQGDSSSGSESGESSGSESSKPKTKWRHQDFNDLSFDKECTECEDEEECCPPGIDLENDVTIDINNCCEEDTESKVRQLNLNEMFCDHTKLQVKQYKVKCDRKTGGKIKDADDFDLPDNVKERYCKMYCSERVHITTPGAITSTSGRYFALSKFKVDTPFYNSLVGAPDESSTPYIEEVRRCRITIAYDVWEKDYYDIVKEEADAYNDYQRYAAYYHGLDEAINNKTSARPTVHKENNGDHTVVLPTPGTMSGTCYYTYNNDCCSGYTDENNVYHCIANPDCPATAYESASYDDSKCDKNGRTFKDYSTPTMFQDYFYYEVRVKDEENEEFGKHMGFYFSAATPGKVAKKKEIKINPYIVDYASANEVASCVNSAYSENKQKAEEHCRSLGNNNGSVSWDPDYTPERVRSDTPSSSGDSFISGAIPSLFSTVGDCAGINEYMSIESIRDNLGMCMNSAKSVYQNKIQDAKTLEEYLSACDRYFDFETEKDYSDELHNALWNEQTNMKNHYDVSGTFMKFSYEQIYANEKGEAQLSSVDVEFWGLFGYLDNPNDALNDATGKYSCKVRAYDYKHTKENPEYNYVENDDDVFPDNYSDKYSKDPNKDPLDGTKEIAVSDAFFNPDPKLCFTTISANSTYDGDWESYVKNQDKINDNYEENESIPSDCFKKYVKRKEKIYKADKKFTTDGAFNAVCNWVEKDKEFFTLIPGGFVTESLEEAKIGYNNYVKHHYEYRVKLNTYEGKYETFWEIQKLGNGGSMQKYFNNCEKYGGTCTTCGINDDSVKDKETGVVSHDTSLQNRTNICDGDNPDNDCSHDAPLTCTLTVKDKLVTVGYCPANGISELAVWDTLECPEPYDDPYNFKFKIADGENLFPTAVDRNTNPVDSKDQKPYAINWYTEKGKTLKNILESNPEDIYSPNNIRFSVVLSGNDIEKIKKYNTTRIPYGGYRDFELRCDCDVENYGVNCIHCDSIFLEDLNNRHMVGGESLSEANHSVSVNITTDLRQGRGTDSNKWKVLETEESGI